MTVPCRDDQPVAAQRRGAQCRGRLAGDVECHIDLAVRQCLRQLAAAEIGADDLHAGSIGGDARDDIAEKAHLGGRPHRDAEGAVARSRIEIRCGDHREFDAAQRGAHRLDDRSRERGGDEPAADPHEQLVAEFAPQPPERVADCGLRQIEVTRRQRHAGARIDRLEHREQIEVEARIQFQSKGPDIGGRHHYIAKPGWIWAARGGRSNPLPRDAPARLFVAI